uniref:Uncharacterized protein n=1 Tax=Rhizophora mucronata TaxID=61149 RepID=A0A2P2PIU4_RHIMU
MGFWVLCFVFDVNLDDICYCGSGIDWICGMSCSCSGIDCLQGIVIIEMDVNVGLV